MSSQVTVRGLVLAAACLSMPLTAASQQAGTSTAAVAVPRLVQFNGAIAQAGGETTVRFALYAAQSGGEPVWSETQSVPLDAKGRFAVLLGAATEGGLPQNVFSSSEARWLGVTVEGAAELPRTILVATPYSLKTVDAETLGGHPASDFALAQKTGHTPDTGTDITQVNAGTGIDVSGNGTAAVTVSIDQTYLGNLASGYAALHGNNTFTGSNTFPSTTVNGNLTITGSINSAYLNSLAAQVPLLTGNNAFKGTNTFAQSILLEPVGTATASTGYSSASLGLYDSIFNSSTARAISQGYVWQTEAAFNDVSSPASTLNLLYNNGVNRPSETGLYIGPDGHINFSSGQSFPGAGTVTGVTAGTDLTGGGSSGVVTLNLNTSALETTLNSIYPQLSAANNAFSGAASFNGTTSSQTLSATNYDTTAGYGLNASGYNGVAAAGTNYGVYAYGTNYGVYASSGTNGSGVYASGASGLRASGTNYGVFATGGTTGVFGSGTTQGGDFGGASLGLVAISTNSSSGATSTGIIGQTSGISKGNTGVTGRAPGSSNAAAVYGLQGSASTTGSTYGQVGGGLWGDTNTAVAASGFTLYFQPAILATADNNLAMYAINNSNFPTVYAINENSEGTLLELTNSSTGGTCVVDNNANLSCSGTVGTDVVAHGAGADRRLETYGMQSSESWIEDFGSGHLQSGRAVVLLEPNFAQTVNTDLEYHVFLTPNGESNGLYVTEKKNHSFEVREVSGGSANIAFDYRIVARRRGDEGKRLADVTADKVRNAKAGFRDQSRIPGARAPLQ